MYGTKLAAEWKLTADCTCVIKWSIESRKPHTKYNCFLGAKLSSTHR